MLQDLRALNRGLPEADRIDLGIGIHTGQAMLGVLGGGAKLEFTVIGDTVNTAARLQEHTKSVNAAVVVSGQTVAALVEGGGLERREPVLLRGRTAPVEVFIMANESGEGASSPATAPRAGPA